jgi:hypothetical protein
VAPPAPAAPVAAPAAPAPAARSVDALAARLSELAAYTRGLTDFLASDEAMLIIREAASKGQLKDLYEKTKASTPLKANDAAAFLEFASVQALKTLSRAQLDELKGLLPPRAPNSDYEAAHRKYLQVIAG